jgi:hypothetical protein
MIYMKKAMSATATILRMAALCLALAPAGCRAVDEIWSDCELPLVRVTVSPVVGVDHDQIDPAEVEHVLLYVFEEATGSLLDIIETRVGEVHQLDFRDHGRLRVVAVGNSAGDRTTVDQIPHGGHISAGRLRMQAASTFLGMPEYAPADDLMWGSQVVENDLRAVAEEVELPIRRIVAGVYISVKGLETIDFLDLDGVEIALGSKYNAFSIDGAHWAEGTRAEADHKMYVRPGSGRHPQNPDIIHAPAAAGANGSRSFNVISTDEGDGVSITITDNEGYTRIMTDGWYTDEYGNRLLLPLKAKNGVLNVFNLEVDNSGAVDVTVSQAAWGSTVEIERPFGE